MSPVPSSVCVFCGSRPGTDPAMMQAARDTGTMLARRGWRLVYGAGDIGLMGATAQATQEAGGRTFGVIPTHLIHDELARASLDALVITETMHERKKVMFANSHAAVVLPGGAGTLDEFFEVVTWAQIGLHGKPVILVDTNGFWQPLIALIDHVIDQGFAPATLRELVTIVPNIAMLEVALAAHLPS
ncbi:TIGR00730 family Rossman fold protein [Rhodobacter sp. NTK016B]|uniref:LOG family protein n=1 Tax=Rhodobacter sp. NTK016B TaxID=2759676 RepID=UPI001A8CDD9D|nr:TIGR00730 family Rossman fold protein [Rhodobacter sp. NTK016B]MBN8291370.1 TIGR00730 family Rossman fold protein [Rhodobacter sp. NTK016B]